MATNKIFHSSVCLMTGYSGPTVWFLYFYLRQIPWVFDWFKVHKCIWVANAKESTQFEFGFLTKSIVLGREQNGEQLSLQVVGVEFESCPKNGAFLFARYHSPFSAYEVVHRNEETRPIYSPGFQAWHRSHLWQQNSRLGVFAKAHPLVTVNLKVNLSKLVRLCMLTIWNQVLIIRLTYHLLYWIRIDNI